MAKRKTKKILLFCDPGIDDSLAIIYTLLDPNLELVGLVTSYGNVTEDQATANAYYLLDLAGQKIYLLFLVLLSLFSRKKLRTIRISMEPKGLDLFSLLLI
ncbi:hypothetical protein HMPREF1013_00054 [Bacillus sp. 2_A_57_CT2]|nr:hypothetical protein HMPREF1013_00054 [Bacillus sp. 2_A_57_CT2]